MNDDGPMKWLKWSKPYFQYEGEFKSGQHHGQGVLIDRRGVIIDGIVHENRFQ